MIYYAQGTSLLTPDELFEPKTFDRVTTFYENIRERTTPGPVELSTGTLALEHLAMNATDAGSVPFSKIGPGLPLTVMVCEVYTGKHRKKDMLITSAIKSITSFEAKPRALNFLTSAVDMYARIPRPKATSQGTPILFYAPALLERSLTLDLDIVFDNFPQDLFTQVGDTFLAAAGIPLFLAHTTFLIGAGLITKLIGKIGETLFDGKPTFTASDGLDISWPGKPPLAPGYVLVTSDNIDNLDPTFREQHHVDTNGTIVDAQNKQYQGDIPYIVISLDGTQQAELANFAPTAASAAVLNRFFGAKDGQQLPLSQLIDAIKLYNDLHYRRDIDRIDKELASLAEGSDEAKTLKDKRAALMKNIFEDLLKPRN